MIDIEVPPDLPKALVKDVLKEGRAMGAPLEVLELILLDRTRSARFVRSCREGRGFEFLESLDLEALRRERSARLLFPPKPLELPELTFA